MSVDYQVYTVYSIENSTKGLTNVIRAIAEACLPVHLPTCGANIRALCIGYNVLGIKSECFYCLTSENQHFILVSLDGSNRESLDKVWINHFEIAPIFLSQGVSVFATKRISTEICKVIAVKHANHQERRILALASLLAWHKIDFLVAHDDSCSV